MKKLILSLLLCSLLGSICIRSEAQLLKRIKNEVQSKVEKRTVSKSGDVTDKVMDKTENSVKQTISGKNESGENTTAGNSDYSSSTKKESISRPTLQDYKNYDFVPGDKIIFQPDMSNEPDAELPARFTIKKGTAEIQSFEGEKMLHLQPDANTAVEPLMSTNHYLPEQFTLEFDVMYENPDDYFRYASDFRVGFNKRDDENYYNGGVYAFIIHNTSKCSLGQTGTQSFPPALEKSFGAANTWHHVAIYVRKNIGKAYVDAYRVCATNTLPTEADKFYIKADRYGVKIKNVRLAAGGDDKYNKIITNGKFITHGILFDINKSFIKPESMGALNEIVKLMKAHDDLKFEIDGHTDSDGNNDTNMKLSQARAEAVKSKLIDMGIETSRLTAKGFGETKPIDKNDSAEGKANNRRVEFVKM